MALVIRNSCNDTTISLKFGFRKDPLATTYRDAVVLSVFRLGEELSSSEIERRLELKEFKTLISRTLNSLMRDGKIRRVLVGNGKNVRANYRYRVVPDG